MSFVDNDLLRALSLRQPISRFTGGSCRSADMCQLIGNTLRRMPAEGRFVLSMNADESLTPGIDAGTQVSQPGRHAVLRSFT